MCEQNIPSAIEKGSLGEESLNLWFQENCVSYLPIKQSADGFAQAFKDRIKRPDYLVLLESIGMIAVDAKNCTLYHGQFTLAIAELERAIAFELSTRLAFWFAFLFRGKGEYVWYWINAVRALERGAAKTNGHNGEDFLQIGLNNFVPIRTQHDLGRLITRRLTPAPNIQFNCG